MLLLQLQCEMSNVMKTLLVLLISDLLLTSNRCPKEKKYKWRREDYQEQTRGLLMVHTGNGKGKTTCALGLMMRAAGRGLKCCMIQFMKSRNDRYGEHESAEKLGIEVHTMGDGFTWDTKNPEQDIKPPARRGSCASKSCASATTTCWSLMNWSTC